MFTKNYQTLRGIWSENKMYTWFDGPRHSVRFGMKALILELVSFKPTNFNKSEPYSPGMMKKLNTLQVMD